VSTPINLPSDTDLINAMQARGWDIDAPDLEEGEKTWVVYDKDHALGAGLACSKDLRAALVMAFTKTQ